MRRFLSLLAAMLTLSVTPVQAAPELPPKLLVVFFDAEWCPNCPSVRAALKQVRADGGFDASKVLFVTLDMSNGDTTTEAKRRAKELGIYDYFEKRRFSVGYLTIFDAATKTDLKRFYRTASSEDMRRALQDFLAE